MKRSILSFILFSASAVSILAQNRTVQNRPYIDLRPMHFGVLVGIHLQDLSLTNVGPQDYVMDEGGPQRYDVTVDQDRWDQGFQVGVLAEMRFNTTLQFRLSPTLYFGARHLTFRHLNAPNPTSPTTSQTLKTVYMGCDAALIFGAKRLNNHRPYLMMGLNPMINLTGSESQFIRLKRYDVFLEAGMGCDFYLPFFKLRPEIKFMYGLTDAMDHRHTDRIKNNAMLPYARAARQARSKMVVLTFYFE